MPTNLLSTSRKAAAKGRTQKTRQAQKPQANTPNLKGTKAKSSRLATSTHYAQQLSTTNEEIAVRAYSISQQRIYNGAPGDALSDWLQAEAELRTLKR